ncbi:MAG: tetratricopeptide repeat protein [Proteobacteria bacterium]|nr:tetratricopeptide repeat protein [Pseudomonadota bacterium]
MIPPSTPTSLLPSGRLAALALLLAAVGFARADDLADVQRLQAAGQADAALQKADAYLATHPKDASMRFLKGVVLADAKREGDAIDVFRQLTEDYPELPEPYNNLATLYAARGDYDAARAQLDQALRANPNFGMAYENLGDVYVMLARRAYARAGTLEPNNAAVPAKLTLLRELLARKPAAGAASAVAR